MTQYSLLRPERRQAPGRGNRFRPRLEALEERALLSVYTVDRLTDLGEGAGLAGDLRYAITQANAVPGDDTITFAVTGTINLSSALPNLSSNIDLQGPGAGLLTVRRNTGFYRIFGVTSSATVVLSGLTITNGFTLQFGCGIGNDGTLTLNNAIVTGNSAPDQTFGGGIYNGYAGTLTLNNSTVSYNDAGIDGIGGGIHNDGTMTLNNSTVSGNLGDAGGGGIFGGRFTLNNSTVSGNSAYHGAGGGIFGGTFTLNNSTVSGNSAGGGGGISIYGGTVALNNSTVSGNSVPGFGGTGGGIRNQGTLTTRNTILAGNTAGTAPDLSGDLGSLGHNLIGNTSGGSGFHETDLLNVNPLLGILIGNGGPTWTHALLPDSPALNAGDPAAGGWLGHPKWDQRGADFARIAGGRLDIGAFEVQGRGGSSPGAALPPRFVTGGVVTTAPPPIGPRVSAGAMAVQPDGKIIVVGKRSFNEGDDDFVLLRLNGADGSPDGTFGTGGWVETDFVTTFGGTISSDGAGAVGLQPDGKIVLAGTSNVLGTTAFALARYEGDSPTGPQPVSGGGDSSADLIAALASVETTPEAAAWSNLANFWNRRRR